MGIPKPVVELAARQGGYVTRAQLIASGLSPSAIDRRVYAGALVKASHGIYVVIESEDPVDLIRGACLALSGAVVSHQSAAHLLRFPRLPALQPTVAVPSHTTHRFPGVTVRRCDDLIESETVQVDGLPVTNTTRTFFDLGALLDFKEYDAIGETLVIAGRLELNSFRRTLGRLGRRGKPGTRAARDFLQVRVGEDQHATVLERKGWAILASTPSHLPVPQYAIPWDTRSRFDVAYPDERLAIEWDSRGWHEQRRAMASDRKRDRQAAIHGWVLLRFTWDDVTKRPREVATTVEALLNDRRVAS